VSPANKFHPLSVQCSQSVDVHELVQLHYLSFFFYFHRIIIVMICGFLFHSMGYWASLAYTSFSIAYFLVSFIVLAVLLSLFKAIEDEVY